MNSTESLKTKWMNGDDRGAAVGGWGRSVARLHEHLQRRRCALGASCARQRCAANAPALGTVTYIGTVEGSLVLSRCPRSAGTNRAEQNPPADQLQQLELL